MPVSELLNLTADIILFYYSLIYKIKITETLRSDIRYTVHCMWDDFINDFYNELPKEYFQIDKFESVDILYWQYCKHYENIQDLRDNITYEITAYLKDVESISNDSHVISLNVVPFAGLTFKHNTITRIINFYRSYN